VGFESASRDKPLLESRKLIPVLNRQAKIDVSGGPAGGQAEDMVKHQMAGGGSGDEVQAVLLFGYLVDDLQHSRDRRANRSIWWFGDAWRCAAHRWSAQFLDYVRRERQSGPHIQVWPEPSRGEPDQLRNSRSDPIPPRGR